MNRITGSLLATRLMLPPDAAPTRLVAFGAGAQIFAHATLLLTAYPSITTCMIFNREFNGRLLSLMFRLGQKFPERQINGEQFTELYGRGRGRKERENPKLREELSKADIIVTATSSERPLFPAEYVKTGAHLCLIGSYTPAM